MMFLFRSVYISIVSSHVYLLNCESISFMLKSNKIRVKTSRAVSDRALTLAKRRMDDYEKISVSYEDQKEADIVMQSTRQLLEKDELRVTFLTIRMRSLKTCDKKHQRRSQSRVNANFIVGKPALRPSE